MSGLSQISDFQMPFESQVTGFEFLKISLKNSRKISKNFRYKVHNRTFLRINQILKMQRDSRLQNFGSFTGFRTVLTNPPKINRSHPP